MSHEHRGRAACLVTRWIPDYHFELSAGARGVTVMIVGSGALFGPLIISPGDLRRRFVGSET